MTYEELRTQYPKFCYESYLTNDNELVFHYSVSDLRFVHKISFENLQPSTLNPKLIFNLGLAEMFSYWKLTGSPEIEIRAGMLTEDQTKWWKKLLIHGMGQYFFENKIDFTTSNFPKIISTGPTLQQTNHNKLLSSHNSVLVPLGGGKDSIVTAELLKPHYQIKTIVVHPTSPASVRISKMLEVSPIQVNRVFDPKLKVLNTKGYLNGHIPYSAVLAFIFLLVADAENIPYIAVSNEASSNEGNLQYLGHEINHQYTKSLEFETNLNDYIAKLNLNIRYFSFLRPLHELQIAKLFSKFPKYLDTFRSCNRNQQQDSWCGSCAKCISIAMTLGPWISSQEIEKIFNGQNPLNNPKNNPIIESMTNPKLIKPFECVTTLNEAQTCLEFLQSGQTSRVKNFLTHWDSSPNTPNQFIEILKKSYDS